jgi:PAS domain S-box-containing protein
MGNHLPYLTFILAVAVTVWLAGFWPAILAIAICIPTALIFVIPSLEPPAVWFARTGVVVLYLAVMVTIALLGRTLSQARLRAEKAATQAQEHYQELQREINDRHQAVEAVARAKLEWERTFNSVPDLIAILGNDHRVVRVNHAMAKRLGLEPDQCVGLTCYQAFHGADTPLATCPHQLTLADGKEHSAEIHDDRLGGDFLISTTPLRDAQGYLLGTVHMARDITDRKRAEESLRQSEERLRGTFDYAGMGIMEVDEHLRIIAVNNRACEILDCPREKLLGQTVHELTALEDRPLSKDINTQLVEGQLPRLDYQKRYLRCDGKPVWVHVTVTPIRDPDGRFIRAIGTFEDISNRIRTEEVLRQTASELARSNRDLEQFAYVASHDLQEPLRMVSGHLKVIEDRLKDKLDEKTRESMFFAVDGATRMRELIRDLLTFSRAGRKGEGFLPTDMENVLGGVTANLGAAILEAGAAIDHDPLPTIQAERVQMMQLLQNLIGNAVKYRVKDRKPQIRIAASRGKEEWLFSVRDNGIGIDPKHSQRVFEIFQRLHTRQEYAGTGIGLAVCKRIVEYHGGRIWLESVPGEGSTFFFTIPDRI